MEIKLQGLLNAVDLLAETYGPIALDKILERAGTDVRIQVETGIAINWHAMSEFVTFLRAAEEVVGTGDGRVATLIGAAGARKNVGGTVVKAVFYMGKREFLLRRVAGLWRRYNSEGMMHVREFRDGHVTVEVEGVPEPEWLFCCTLTGWVDEMGRALGTKNPRTRHVECRAHGAERCVWRGRFDGLDTDDDG